MSKEDNKTRITNALAAVAAGALTNIFCDELLGGKFEGEIIDGSVWLVKVPYLNFWCRAGQVIGAFVISWLVIIFLISVFPEAIGRLRHHGTPKLTPNTIVKNYFTYREEVIDLYTKGRRSVADLYIANGADFNTICRIINRFDKCFCCEKNRGEVKSAFRSGVTSRDIEKKISDYDFYVIVDIISVILQKSFKTLYEHGYEPGKNDKMQKDYENAMKTVGKLYDLYRII